MTEFAFQMSDKSIKYYKSPKQAEYITMEAFLGVLA